MTALRLVCVITYLKTSSHFPIEKTNKNLVGYTKKENIYDK